MRSAAVRYVISQISRFIRPHDVNNENVISSEGIFISTRMMHNIVTIQKREERFSEILIVFHT